MGWDDAPAHVCRGGDIRGLAFCCPPVKPCPVHTKLAEVGLSPQEFVNIKEEFGKKTELGKGTGTCFGSLIWCCKASKPCPLRDSVLQSIGMSHDTYMTLKKELANEIVKHSNVNEITYSDKDISTLAETFNITIDEARNALTEAGNDLKTAIKNLRLKSL
ncbi:MULTISPECIES: methanogenesis marker 9 domain-containing protein [Methanosphaera]|jgi:putative methanogenesis marker domain 9|uniref:Predicted metal-binding transcription factor n=2 Tax=Methanosphaera stadtmanae TaxID=2317 RepID=Q2NEH6_METST|nr:MULTISPECIES: methanogenesis marker 9 domain-containing protein [Methanosphaera]ABC57777.1 predicted metal-binding transcription factor [Methanosphaera stadtmanae DSM 3091]MDO5822813.1 methanogenesis marker 9 domain-containing protein [Methanosphaera sp.]MEE0490125.1 methanogenesis marker 9 domain-containing protein [Methanosphaera stadtmanae]OEC89175.1 metal-binding transcription factor [Methanosphaera sp. A6]RAP02474.1 methanogenesis marker 9 domain-containing protein [Methanosphaera stad